MKTVKVDKIKPQSILTQNGITLQELSPNPKRGGLYIIKSLHLTAILAAGEFYRYA